MNNKINFVDLEKQRLKLDGAIEKAVTTVLEHGKFIQGPEVREFEEEAKKFCEVSNVVSCANGTDALSLALMANNISQNDIVFVPSFTFTSTAEVVCLAGANPYFIDVKEDTFNIDPDVLLENIKELEKKGDAAKAVIAVDLFGLPADYDRLEEICKEYGLLLIVDAAQSFGSIYKERKTGTLGDITTTSFFPAKPLGCYGDGGAILTKDSEIADKIRRLSVHGKGNDKYDNIYIGMNSRLDTIQAAILLEKIKIYDGEIKKRNDVAEIYNQGLSNVASIPVVPDGLTSVWAQYTLKFEEEHREVVLNELKEKDIPVAVYYPKPLHKQTAYQSFDKSKKGLAVSEKLSRSCLSLPMHPYLSNEEQQLIIDTIKNIS